MKIFELLGQQNQTAKETKTVTDVVAQEVVPEQIDGTIIEHDDHSAITEGVSQILRRVKGKGIQKGFRCTSGPRKGRIVKKAATCFAKRDPVKGTKIAKKRQAKARTAGKKLAITKRSGPVSRRLKGAQIKTAKSGRGGPGARPIRSFSRPFIKSKIVRPKKK